MLSRLALKNVAKSNLGLGMCSINKIYFKFLYFISIQYSKRIISISTSDSANQIALIYHGFPSY